MKVISKPLSELRRMEKNIRRHPEKQVKEYVRSLEMFGQIKPVVIDETGMILAGNGLFEALRSMGAETCQCYVMAGLTPAQKKKVMLADNRVYELGVTDTAIFDEIIKELEGDIDVPGWDADLLEMLNASIADANNIVESYGVYDPSEVEAVASRERPAADPSAAPQAAPASEAQQPAASAPVPSQEPRVVLCPKCGERICL